MHRMQKRWIWAVGVSAIVVALVVVGIQFQQSQSLDREANHLSQLLNLKPGATVAEIGAGDGSMAVQIAAAVKPGGILYATELRSEELNTIRQNAKNRNLVNVQVVQGAVDGTRLPSNCCDAILMRDVYHHFSQPRQMNASLWQSLRPGGLLAVVDFPPDWFLSTFWKLPDVPANRGGHGIPQEVLADVIDTSRV